MPGLVLDLTVNDPDDDKPWDFTQAAKREKVRGAIRTQQPFLLIGATMCKAFSARERSDSAKCGNPKVRERLKAETALHVEFVTELYRQQIDQEGYFLHEHSKWASSRDFVFD